MSEIFLLKNDTVCVGPDESLLISDIGKLSFLILIIGLIFPQLFQDTLFIIQ